MEDLDFEKIENDFNLNEITESDLEKPKKEKREYKKKDKKIDYEKEGNSIGIILQFFSKTVLKNELPTEQLEFHKETARQISEQYEIKISEYILFIRIIVSIGLLLIHYYLTIFNIFRKKEDKKLETQIPEKGKNEIVS